MSETWPPLLPLSPPSPEQPATLGSKLLKVSKGEIAGYLVITKDFDFKYEFVGPNQTVGDLPGNSIREPLTREGAIEIISMASAEELLKTSSEPLN